jgi:hypothetical protein
MTRWIILWAVLVPLASFAGESPPPGREESDHYQQM